jgi:hypothetical protein
MGRDSSVGIATRYRLDGPGMNPGGCEISRTCPEPTQPSIQWITNPFPGVKRPGCGVDYPPPSSAEAKERAELYLWAFVACSRVNFTVSFYWPDDAKHFFYFINWSVSLFNSVSFICSFSLPLLFHSVFFPSFLSAPAGIGPVILCDVFCYKPR